MPCTEWLDGFFPKGWRVHCTLIREAARKRGYSRFQLKAARKALGIKTVSERMRYYALCGRPNEVALKRLRDTLPKESKEHYNDLTAVHNMLKRLESEEYGAVGVKCVEMVYFANPSHSLSRSEITHRVIAAALELNICESAVYKALRRARKLIAIERGLRTEEDSSHLKQYFIRKTR